MGKAKTMKIGDPRQCDGRYMPDGSIQHVNIGVMSLTGQAQKLLLNDGSTVQGLSARSFLDSQEIVCPPDLLPPSPAGVKPNPTPPGAHAIGAKVSFTKAYMLDQKYGAPRELDPSGLTLANAGQRIVTGRDFVTLKGVRTQGYCHRKDLLSPEFWSPIA